MPLWFLLISLLLPPAWAGRGARKDESALRERHEAYGRLVSEGSWQEAATMMHPKALHAFREAFGDLLDVTSPTGATFGEAFFGGANAARIASLDDGAFYATFLDSVLSMTPDLRATMATSTMETKAIAYGSEGEAYIVYDMAMSPDGETFHKLGVTTAERTDDGQWGFMLSGDIETISRAIQHQVRALKQQQASDAAVPVGPPAEEPSPSEPAPPEAAP